MNYRIEGNSAFANEGYVFQSKEEPEFMVTCMDAALLDKFICIEKPVEEEQEVKDYGESDVSV